MILRLVFDIILSYQELQKTPPICKVERVWRNAIARKGAHFEISFEIFFGGREHYRPENVIRETLCEFSRLVFLVHTSLEYSTYVAE
jgi:hypothetical protein